MKLQPINILFKICVFTTAKSQSIIHEQLLLVRRNRSLVCETIVVSTNRIVGTQREVNLLIVVQSLLIRRVVMRLLLLVARTPTTPIGRWRHK